VPLPDLPEQPPPAASAARLPRLLADLLRAGQSVRLEVTGHSMAPFLRPGDVLTIAPCRGASPSQGEVVAFAPREDRLLVHRLVARREDGLLLRGDAAPQADPLVARADVLGVVTRAERCGQRVRVGLGPERRAVAWLSRIGLLRLLGRLRAGRRAGEPD
jgi:hypothetical protein